jgi:Alginate lyase
MFSRFDSIRRPNSLFDIMALLVLLFSGVVLTGCCQTAATDVLTEGWTSAPLKFKVQVPYNLNESDRYSFSHGIYHLWVYSNDLSLRKDSKTKPRSEMRFPDYTSGWQQFSADVYVPSGTSGVCIMQIHTGDKKVPHAHVGATIMMAFVIDGTLHFYSKNIITQNVYDHWFHLNVMHNTKNNHIDIYINGQLRYATIYHGKANDWYMKCGVYSQRHASPEMQVYFQNVKLWTK